MDIVRLSGIHAVVPAVLERWSTAEFRLADPESVALTCAMLEANRPEGYVANCAAVREADLRGDVQQIVTPTLVVYGKHDLVTPPSDARFLIENISTAQLIELEAAHLSNVEAASAFTAGIFHFLTQGDSHG